VSRMARCSPRRRRSHAVGSEASVRRGGRSGTWSPGSRPGWRSIGQGLRRGGPADARIGGAVPPGPRAGSRWRGGGGAEPGRPPNHQEHGMTDHRGDERCRTPVRVGAGRPADAGARPLPASSLARGYAWTFIFFIREMGDDQETARAARARAPIRAASVPARGTGAAGVGGSIDVAGLCLDVAHVRAWSLTRRGGRAGARQ
jgi:hypothetical protein